MNGIEIDDALGRITIIVDTREQSTIRARRRFQQFGEIERMKLTYGDYSALVRLEDGREISLADKVNIERKMNIDELAMCLGRQRARFEREFQRMKDLNGTCYLLVEGFTWEKVINHEYRSQMSPESLIGSLISLIVRYKIRLIACQPTTSGRLIKKILTREMKEMLMNEIHT